MPLRDARILCLFPKPKASSRLGVKNWKDLIRLGWMTSINHFPFEKKIFGVLKPPEKFVAAVRELTERNKKHFSLRSLGMQKDWKLMLKIDSEIHCMANRLWIESKVTTMNPSTVQKKETTHFWLLEIAKIGCNGVFFQLIWSRGEFTPV